MTCTQTQPLLDAYADHALPAWQTYHVRRHLTACAACTAELADIQRLGAAVRAWRDTPALPTLSPRIAAALPPATAFQTPRRAFPLRPAAVGLASLAAAVR